MNKKLLFAAMSLAALTACTDNDFESKNVAQQEASPVVFEVLNNNDAFTRASMNGNKVAWSATDGDLFTLYHGGTVDTKKLTKCQNATYTAAAAEGSPAVLTTPSMILAGKAIMVWPVDTAFTYDGADLTISIPEKLTNIENNIPYVSDLINIKGRTEAGTHLGDPNTAGYNRTYPIYMRPMASQLTVKADYAGTETVLDALYTGEDPIEPISVTSVDLLTDDAGGIKFTTKISLEFKGAGANAAWAAVEGNAWEDVTDFGSAVTPAAKLTTTCVTGNESAKFLILPQANITGGVVKGGVAVNTLYGKVIVADHADIAESQYSDDEIADAWYRYTSAATVAATGETKATSAETAGDNAGKFKTTANVKMGMQQTINGFSTFKASSGTVKGEPIGAAATRYVKVLLNKLTIDGLHVTSDKQLRDVARVWKHLGGEAPAAVNVILDGDADKEFEISQKTIEVINALNAETATDLVPIHFTVKPCIIDGEKCEKIVIIGGGDIQDMPFIVKNGTIQADVILNAGESWNWKGTDTSAEPTAIKTIKVGDGVKSIINKGTMTNAATATLAIYNAAATQILTVPFTNEGTWNITAGTLNVQFNVTNLGTVNIDAHAQYRQDGNAGATIFTNEAKTLPQRFLPANKTAEIGVVNNSGVFATVGTGANVGTINNYGLIEHAKGAKTYITNNQQGGAPSFAETFNAEETHENKLGQINLMWDNKDDNNLAISNAHQDGFVSVTITTENAPANKTLAATTVAPFVNYVIIKGGIENVTGTPTAAKPIFVELNQPGKEVIWGASGDTPYAGMILLSDINIQRSVAVKSSVTYLAADIYLGGSFTCADYNGYYGDTSAKAATNIITW